MPPTSENKKKPPPRNKQNKSTKNTFTTTSHYVASTNKDNTADAPHSLSQNCNNSMARGNTCAPIAKSWVIMFALVPKKQTLIEKSKHLMEIQVIGFINI